jgi:hypothetical protein
MNCTEIVGAAGRLQPTIPNGEKPGRWSIRALTDYDKGQARLELEDCHENRPVLPSQ